MSAMMIQDSVGPFSQIEVSRNGEDSVLVTLTNTSTKLSFSLSEHDAELLSDLILSSLFEGAAEDPQLSFNFTGEKH